ncbi:YeeE/YedE family protein [Virgibacillus halophilus]|uniref:YeeE/YedE family protein n=2 Tax=Tigheibacillus halophilus TaxID=361280 RepID=A0ABU5C3F4_9BACI|nr:YeeE/YedE family protein [Virgibacillus halophilus]
MILGAYIFMTTPYTQLILYGLGLALGFTLFHARFGFTSAFRRLMSVGNVEGIQAHMVMLAVASTLFAIIFATGYTLTGATPSGNISPIGTSLIFGSFIFGIGMQLGGGCASGTLYHVGSGQSPTVITLIGFIAGSVIGAYHWGFWMNDTPSLGSFSLAESTNLGYFGAWMVQIALLAIIYWITVQFAKRRKPPIMKALPTERGWKRILRGSWPLVTAAIVLAVLNAGTLFVKGSPWGITSGFALWGSKIASLLGMDVASWTYWSGDKAEALHSSVFQDSTSVMNFGIILGAFIASASGGLFKPKRFKKGVALASLVGGIMMGYGARLAFGCNIGAYFSGIASFSLHGWIWGIMALLGTFAALFIRPLFGLSNPHKNDHFC